MRAALATPGCLVVLALACACSAPPKITPVTPADADPLIRTCLAHYPPGSFALVHAIEATLPLGNASSVIGVSSWDEETHTLSAALLAPEGIALFEAARLGGTDLLVTRALAPLDRPGFAAGLFEDLDFMYFPPGQRANGASVKGGEPVPGRYADGRSVCRWTVDGRYFDLVPAADGGFSLSEYFEGGEPLRRYEAGPPASDGFPMHARFVRTGATGYSMSFRLVEQ